MGVIERASSRQVGKRLETDLTLGTMLILQTFSCRDQTSSQLHLLAVVILLFSTLLVPPDEVVLSTFSVG